MILPNAHTAIIEREKITDYCLNDLHPTGKNKSRVFKSALGMDVTHADELIEAIKRAIITENVIIRHKDSYGQRYAVDFLFRIFNKHAVIRTNWIIKSNEVTPRLTSCFVK